MMMIIIIIIIIVVVVVIILCSNYISKCFKDFFRSLFFVFLSLINATKKVEQTMRS